MEVLERHKARVTQLRGSLDELIKLHADLREMRNAVLAKLSGQSGPRLEPLPEIRSHIRDISRKIDQLRSEVFGARPGVAGTLARSLVDSFDTGWNIWLGEAGHEGPAMGQDAQAPAAQA